MLLNYLMEKVKRGERYFKAKYIARELGMSSKRVGTLLGILANECKTLKIERWGHSRSTTWKIEVNKF